MPEGDGDRDVPQREPPRLGEEGEVVERGAEPPGGGGDDVVDEHRLHLGVIEDRPIALRGDALVDAESRYGPRART